MPSRARACPHINLIPSRAINNSFTQRLDSPCQPPASVPQARPACACLHPRAFQSHPRPPPRPPKAETRSLAAASTGARTAPPAHPPRLPLDPKGPPTPRAPPRSRRLQRALARRSDATPPRRRSPSAPPSPRARRATRSARARPPPPTAPPRASRAASSPASRPAQPRMKLVTKPTRRADGAAGAARGPPPPLKRRKPKQNGSTTKATHLPGCWVRADLIQPHTQRCRGPVPSAPAARNAPTPGAPAPPSGMLDIFLRTGRLRHPHAILNSHFPPAPPARPVLPDSLFLSLAPLAAPQRRSVCAQRGVRGMLGRPDTSPAASCEAFAAQPRCRPRALRQVADRMRAEIE